MKVPGRPNTYRLKLAATGADRLDLTYTATRAPMYVNGNGNTGVDRPEDMKYVSLTRCAVTGTGNQEPLAGQGWIDHQWGNTWTTQRVGWDWFGVQLNDGTDINFFRQRDAATGEIIHPTATFEDSRGDQSTTHAIRFQPDLNSIWTSPDSGITYPLHWSITFPEKGLTLDITPVVDNQEMPVLASGAIWEGSCRVKADYTDGRATDGVAYMELVGYNSAAMRDAMRKAK
jgi:predicted secreted hydrolase